MTPEQRLWQAVVYRAAMDALNPTDSDEGLKAQREADVWLRRNSKDFRRVCNLAGIDPDFIRDAYVAGRIDAQLLKSVEKAA